jgi:hypothetical protein
MPESELSEVANALNGMPNYLATYGTVRLNESQANLNNAQAELQKYEALYKTALAAKRFAEAEKVRAEAAKIMAEVRLLHAVIDQLQRDLRLLNKSRARMQKDVQRVEEHVKHANKLLLGRQFGTGPNRSWAALETFTSQIYDNAVFSAITITSEARTPDNFIHWKSESEVTAHTPPDVDHILEYIEWMKDMGFLARAGKTSQQLIRQLFAAVSAKWAEVRADLESRMEQLKEGVYGDWHLPHLLGQAIPAEASNAAARIHEK